MFEGILDKIVTLALVFGSVILHEIAHGYMAYRLGDPTARMQGRITLNPLAHIDLFGTILVPLMLSFSNMPVLGWAKPVPFNPSYFRDPRRGIMLTGAAGPATNFAIAIAAVLLFKMARMLPGTDLLMSLMVNLAIINVYLGMFNLVPIPPLDGSRIAIGLIPHTWVGPYLRIERFGFLILLALLWIDIGGRSVVSWVLEPLVTFVLKLMF